MPVSCGRGLTSENQTWSSLIKSSTPKSPRPPNAEVTFSAISFDVANAFSFENIPKALAEQGVDIRLFGKPQSFKRRRMGVILAHADDIQHARNKAQQARSQIKTKPV